MEISILYVTAPTREVALSLAKTLVSEHLIACGNILDQVTSVYRWQNEIQTESEAVLILKTRPELIDTVTERIKSLHPYECPCVVALKSQQGNSAFFDWVNAETQPE